MTAMAEQQKLFGDSDPLTAANAKRSDVDLEFFKKAQATSGS